MNPRAIRGFTVVEIAIVFIVFGLVLGVVLKGQELIFNAKVRATFNLSRELAAAVQLYRDRYQVLPGDDPQAATRFPAAVPPAVNGNGNGAIDWQSTPCPAGTGGGGENCQVFYHLRLAGFLSGSLSDAPRHPFGGSVSIARQGALIPQGSNEPAMVIQNGSVPGRAMGALDTQFDDGHAATGVVRCNQAAYNLTPPDAMVASWCTVQL